MGAGFISQDELSEVMEVQQETDKRLGQVLIELDLITELNVVEDPEYQLGIWQVDLKKFVIDPEMINLIPQDSRIQM